MRFGRFEIGLLGVLSLRYATETFTHTTLPHKLFRQRLITSLAMNPEVTLDQKQWSHIQTEHAHSYSVPRTMRAAEKEATFATYAEAGRPRMNVHTTTHSTSDAPARNG